MLKKLKIELPYDLTIPYLSAYIYIYIHTHTDLEKMRALILKDIHTLIFIVALFTIAIIGSNPSVHQQQMDKKDVR